MRKVVHMSIKIAFSTISCPSYTAAEQATAARDYGYDGVELYALEGERLTVPLLDNRLDELRHVFRSAGVPVVAINSWGTFSMPDAEERMHMEARVLRCLELAAALDCGQVKTFGGELPADQAREEVFDYMAEHLGRIARRGEELGVTLLLETHDGFAASSHVAALLERVPSSRFAALWDVHHTHRMGETPEQVDTTIGARVRHVHVKDSRRIGHPPVDHWDFVLLGARELAPDVQEALHVLARRDFHGYVAVDWEKMWYPEIAGPEIALPHFARVLRAYTKAAEHAMGANRNGGTIV